MAANKLTTDNIRAIIATLATKGGIDETDAILSVYDLLPRTIQSEVAEQRVDYAIEYNDIEGLNMTQLRQFAKRKGYKNYSTYKAEALRAFCSSGGSTRPEGPADTPPSPARVELEEKKSRRTVIIEASSPDGDCTFGTEEWATQDLEVLTVSNLKTIAKLDKDFMKGSRADMMGMKRDALLEAMTAYRTIEAEVEAEVEAGVEAEVEDDSDSESDSDTPSTPKPVSKKKKKAAVRKAKGKLLDLASRVGGDDESDEEG